MVSMGVLDHLRVLWVSFIVVIMKILAFDPCHQRTSDLSQSMDFGKVTFCQILHLLGTKTGPKHHGTLREASYMP